LYRQQYKSPEWPGGKSGVTVGIGYDLGYTNKETFREEWQDFVDKSVIDKLSAACTVKGDPAEALAKSLQGVEVEGPAGLKQYTTKPQPLYIGETIGSLPNADALPDDSLGALVSLVYNRGSPFSNSDDRYREMRNIKAHMVAQKFDKIPDELRSMK